MYPSDKNLNLIDKTLNDTMINAQSHLHQVCIINSKLYSFSKAIVSVPNYRGLQSVTGGVTLVRPFTAYFTSICGQKVKVCCHVAMSG